MAMKNQKQLDMKPFCSQSYVPQLREHFQNHKAVCILGVWEYSNIGHRDLEKTKYSFENRLILRIMSEKHGFQKSQQEKYC